jgi:hypothetical protein
MRVIWPFFGFFSRIHISHSASDAASCEQASGDLPVIESARDFRRRLRVPLWPRGTGGTLERPYERLAAPLGRRGRNYAESEMCRCDPLLLVPLIHSIMTEQHDRAAMGSSRPLDQESSCSVQGLRMICEIQPGSDLWRLSPDK